jgi:hypothetical protein
MEQRANSKHGARLDDELERETEDLTRSGQPSRTQEWREPEPIEGDHLHLAVPPDHEPGAPAGMTAADAERRSDIARYLPPRAFPADRDTLLGCLARASVPDDIYDAVRNLPAGRQFATIGEVVRALGIPTEVSPNRQPAAEVLAAEVVKTGLAARSACEKCI